MSPCAFACTLIHVGQPDGDSVGLQMGFTAEWAMCSGVQCLQNLRSWVKQLLCLLLMAWFCLPITLFVLCSAGKDIKVGLDEPRNMSLDDALEYINDDELVEV